MVERIFSILPGTKPMFEAIESAKGVKKKDKDKEGEDEATCLKEGDKVSFWAECNKGGDKKKEITITVK